MKIAFFEIEPWEKDYIKKKLEGHDVIFYETPLSKTNISDVKDVEAVSIFIYSKLDISIIEQMPHLRLITTRSTGYDHIDLVTCQKKKIIVCNVPHYGTHTVAEHTFALILALSRKLASSLDRTKRGNFDHHELTGFDLYGKTLGIIGFGDIGRSVMKIAKGFGMHVVSYTHHPDESLAQRLNIHFLGLKELFSSSDVITLHIPYSKKTHHIINKKNITKFKKGSILINTARGGLIETEALILGLEKQIFAGVGLDVLEEETAIIEERQILTKHYLKDSNIKTLFFDHMLMTKENVIITPHNAFNSKEALVMILDITVDNINEFVKNTPNNVLR